MSNQVTITSGFSGKEKAKICIQATKDGGVFSDIYVEVEGKGNISGKVSFSEAQAIFFDHVSFGCDFNESNTGGQW